MVDLSTCCPDLSASPVWMMPWHPFCSLFLCRSHQQRSQMVSLHTSSLSNKIVPVSSSAGCPFARRTDIICFFLFSMLCVTVLFVQNFVDCAAFMFSFSFYSSTGEFIKGSRCSSEGKFGLCYLMSLK